jgi:hypothetical protein
MPELPTNGSKTYFFTCIDWCHCRPDERGLPATSVAVASTPSIRTLERKSTAQNAAAVTTDVTRRMICGGPG